MSFLLNSVNFYARDIRIVKHGVLTMSITDVSEKVWLVEKGTFIITSQDTNIAQLMIAMKRIQEDSVWTLKWSVILPIVVCANKNV